MEELLIICVLQSKFPETCLVFCCNVGRGESLSLCVLLQSLRIPERWMQLISSQTSSENLCLQHSWVNVKIWVKSDLSRASRGSSIHKEEELLTASSPPQTVMWTFLHSERNWTCRKCSVGCEVPSGGVLTQHEQTSGWTKLWVTEEFHTESQKRLPLCRRYLGIQTDNPALSSTQHWPVPAAAAPAGPPPTAGKLSGSSSSHWVTSGRPACIYYHLTTQCWWELLMLIH